MENANVKLETLTGSFCLKNCWTVLQICPLVKNSLLLDSLKDCPVAKLRLAATGNNWAKQESLMKLVLPFSTHLLGAPAYFGKRWGETKGLGSNLISRPTIFFLNKFFMLFHCILIKVENATNLTPMSTLKIQINHE